MSNSKMPVAAEVHSGGDPHTDNLQSAARYVQSLRDEIADLYSRNADLERDNNMMYSEIECLKLQLEAERTERRHYHQYSTSITTSLDLVTRVIDDVLARAVKAARISADENGRAPEIKMPDSLQKWLSRGRIEEPATTASELDDDAARLA